VINIELPEMGFKASLSELHELTRTRHEYVSVRGEGAASISEDYYVIRRGLLNTLLADVDKSRGGIYLFMSGSKYMYAGKSAKLFNRIEQHVSGRGGATRDYVDVLTLVTGFHVDDPYDRDIYETAMIKKFMPRLNISKKPSDVLAI